MATIEKRIYDGDRAREVLENDAFAQAFEDIRQEYTQAWMNSPARDEEGREKLYWMVKLTDKLQATLQGMLADGKMARVQRDQEEEQLARERREGLLIG